MTGTLTGMRFPDFFEEVAGAENPGPSEGGLFPGNEVSPDAPWWIVDPWLSPDLDGEEFILVPSGVESSPDAPPSHEGPPPDSGPGPGVGIATDALALYRPWHFWGRRWGIYLNAPALERYVHSLEADGAGPAPAIAPFALRTVIDHELAHFSVEVGATLLEAARQQPCYRDYILLRFGAPNPIGVAPLEEAYASWREARSRRITGLGTPPGGFLPAVRRNLAACGPGYGDWKRFQSDGPDARIELLALVAGARIVGDDWFESAFIKGRPSQVPLRWVGDPALLQFFGALPKSMGQIPIKRLRAWLSRSLKATEVPSAGKGSHEKWRVPGRGTIGFGHTRDGNLNPRDVRQVSATLDLTPSELFSQVMGG
jgi:hypothetical protein